MAANKEQDSEAYSGFAIANNNMVIDFCRTSVSALAGMSAGVLGLTGLSGFIFYFAASIFLSCLINLKAGHQWRKYFISWWSLSTNGILGGLFTYVLFWTFLYGMVHVY